LLLVPGLSHEVFASTPKPTITWTGVDADGCKIFEISDGDQLARDKRGSLSKIIISSDFFFWGNTIETPEVTNQDPLIPNTTPGNPSIVTSNGQMPNGKIYEITWPNNNPHSITLKICPLDFLGTEPNDRAFFNIKAIDSKDPKLESDLAIISELAKNADGNGEVDDIIRVHKILDCKKLAAIKNSFNTQNVESVDITKCEKNVPGATDLTIKVKVKDKTKPAIVTFVGDPPAQVFLGIFEICTEQTECPIVTDMNILLEATVIVGGKTIPIESTSLLLAGAQTFSWMIPVVLSATGIGLFVVSRKSY